MIIKFLKLLPQQSAQQIYNQYMIESDRYVKEANRIQIKKDITRTYSNTKYFNSEKKEGHERLRRLLESLSHFRKIGYVQGINFIAASFLWHCDEDLAYFIIVNLFSVLQVEKNYTSDLSGIQEKTSFFFDAYLKDHCREIHANLTEKDILPQMILPEWFVTLGSSIIPLQHHISFFMNLYQKGWIYLYKVIGNYLQALFPYFQAEDFGGTIIVIKNCKGEGGEKIHIRWTQILETQF